jgi:hypothetical protein
MGPVPAAWLEISLDENGEAQRASFGQWHVVRGMGMNN